MSASFVAMCPYAVSNAGTAPICVTARIAVITLDKISQESYPTKKTALAAYAPIIAHLYPKSSYAMTSDVCQ